MNPIGINYAYWSETWDAEPLPLVRKTQLCGFDILEIKTAEDCGVIFCLEVVNRFEHYMINTAEEGAAFAQRIDSPSCRLHLDTFHMNIEEDNLRDAIVKAGKWLAYFHVGEANRRPPGRGHIPWSEVFLALREIEYRGPIVMEPFINPLGDAGRDMPVYRDLLGDVDRDEEAALSLRFIRSELGKHRCTWRHK